jgi:hypothetical protein
MHAELFPKVVRDMSMPHNRWHIIIGNLPWYVLNDGSPCPVSLPVIYDDFSQFIIWWQLLAAKRKDEEGQFQRISVTSADICLGIATAL